MWVSLVLKNSFLSRRSPLKACGDDGIYLAGARGNPRTVTWLMTKKTGSRGQAAGRRLVGVRKKRRFLLTPLQGLYSSSPHAFSGDLLLSRG